MNRRYRAAAACVVLICLLLSGGACMAVAGGHEHTGIMCSGCEMMARALQLIRLTAFTVLTAVLCAETLRSCAAEHMCARRHTDGSTPVSLCVRMNN